MNNNLFEIKILCDKENFIAIDKPAGMPFHSSDKNTGILQLLRDFEENGIINKGERIYPVHRLDSITSGILIFARGKKIANQISNEFRFHRVNKIYIAISDRKPLKKNGVIKGDMHKSRNGSWMLDRGCKNPAITYFTSESIPERRPGLRVFFLNPKTGKTHQIRVAMKSIGAPILGDHLYGRYDLARNEDRAYLHAYALQIKIGEKIEKIICKPTSGIEFTTSAFENILNRYNDPFK